MRAECSTASLSINMRVGGLYSHKGTQFIHSMGWASHFPYRAKTKDQDQSIIFRGAGMEQGTTCVQTISSDCRDSPAPEIESGSCRLRYMTPRKNSRKALLHHGVSNLILWFSNVLFLL